MWLCAHAGGERWETRAGRQVRVAEGAGHSRTLGDELGRVFPECPAAPHKGQRASRGVPAGVQRAWRSGDSNASVREMCMCALLPSRVHEILHGHEYWSGLSFPPPGDLSNLGIKPTSPALPADSLPLSHLGSRERDSPL